MAFTYDPSTNIGQVRLLITDNVREDYIFEDEEISSFLTMTENDVTLAAARAYGAIIRSKGLLARRIARDGYSSESHALSELRQLQQDLLAEAVAPTIASHGLQTSEMALGDDHFDSFRPGWRDLGQEVDE